MIIATTPFIAGHRVTETKGQVFGLVVRSRGIGGNLMAGLRSIAGGEIHEYTSLLEDTRRQAIDRMVQNAALVGANAVISMRFDSSELAGTMSEIVAYGTAVVVVPDADAGQAPGVAHGRLACPRPDRRAGHRADRRRPRAHGGGAGWGRALVLFLIVPGVILVVAAMIERLRYRSLSSDGLGESHGPGGGELEPPEPRFRPTEERFVDPTTGVQMRVFVDPRTGERRYLAEG